MPAYDSTWFADNNPARLLQDGVPSYAFGSYARLQPTALLQVTSVARTGGTATIGVTMREGNIPAVGYLVTIKGTATDSGAFNLSNQTITAVSIDATTGIGTIQFALVGTTGTTTDSGQAYIPVPEVAETASVTASRAFAIQHKAGGSYGITWGYTYPSAPASASIQLEGAVNDVDAEYELIGSAQTGTSGYTTTIATVPENVNFVRLNQTVASGGTNPTVIGKILKS